MRRHLKPLMLLLAFLLPILQGHAQTYPEQYLQQALENNPGLLAQHKTWEAALQQADISGALPDPTLSAGLFIPPMKRFMGNQWFDLGIMQMFPWPGTIGKQKSVAEKMADIQYHQYRDERNRLFWAMTGLWLEIFRKEQELKIIERHKEILKSREEIIYTRYQAGQQRSGLTLDIYRLEIQLAALDNNSGKIMEELKALKESFNILIGRQRSAVIDTPEALPDFKRNGLNIPGDALAFDSNPQLNRAQSEAEAANILQEVRRLQTRPMLGVGLQYAYFAAGQEVMGQMNGGHMIMPMVSVSLPVYGKKKRATLQQSQLLAGSAHFRESDSMNALQTQLSKLKAKLSNLQRDREFYEQQLDITSKAWELVINAYASGDEGFDELLRIQDQLLSLEWLIMDNKINHHLAGAELDMLLARKIFE